MATPRQNQTITTQGSFLVGKIPGDRQGCTVLVSGPGFNGATATAAYKAADGTFQNFADPDAVITANGEISIVAGNGIEIFLTVTGADPTGINALVASC